MSRGSRWARAWGTSFLLACAGMSCATSSSVPGSSSASATSPSAGAQSPSSASGAAANPAAASALPSASAARAKEAEKVRFADLVNDLSEPDADFFSDNLISNETSFLQTAQEMVKQADPSGVYIGVGPEQNFSYIALVRPSLAFIVDIRRENMLMHLFYRALFEEAASRADFVALLTGRARPSNVPAGDAPLADVLDAGLAGEANEASFEIAQKVLMTRVAGYGVKLSDKDRGSITAMHRRFHKEQLAIRFELHSKNGRDYPTLRQLIETRSPDGGSGSFLATEDGFRAVQNMQRAGRIVPLVGNFAGDKTLPQLASYLRSEGRSVSMFYVSNVEQYLFGAEDPKGTLWPKWIRNIEALPRTPDAVFVRAYLDQGAKHPRQMKGHRTATVHTRISDLEPMYGTKAPPSFLALCTEKSFGAN